MPDSSYWVAGRRGSNSAGERAVVWDRPALRALCPPGAVPYDAVDPELTPEGSRFRWRELEVTLSVPGAHNAVNAAGALTLRAPARRAGWADLRGERPRRPRSPGARGCL